VIARVVYVQYRERLNREASPIACIIDSQSVKSAEKGGAKLTPMVEPALGPAKPDPWDAGKKIDGKKRQILVDTERLLMKALVRPADIQDREGGSAARHPVQPLLVRAQDFRRCWLSESGVLERGRQHHGQVQVEIVKRSDSVKGFVALPRRWVFERSLACPTGAAVWPRTEITGHEPRSRSCNSPPFASCNESSAIPELDLGRTLTSLRNRRKKAGWNPDDLGKIIRRTA
jgi:transposase